MDRSRELKLIAATYQADSIGQMTTVTTSRTVFCNLSSVTRSEWSAAGQLGLKPEFVATMFAPDYGGESAAQLLDPSGLTASWITYGIYRTYIRDDESIELYLERKAGVTNG